MAIRNQPARLAVPPVLPRTRPLTPGVGFPVVRPRPVPEAPRAPAGEGGPEADGTRPRPSPAVAGTGAAPHRSTVLTGRLRQVWVAAVAVIALQFAGLVAWSWYLWSHFDLTSDFGMFSQAWSQIGTGHLDPAETVYAYGYPHYGYPFWQSHFELVMWPLALLHPVAPSPFDLLVVQDLAIAGIGLVAVRFGLELLERGWPGPGPGRTAVGIGLLVAVVVNPWVYWAASFDFHVEPIAVLFVVVCARDLWAGRRRAWWWAAAVLLCGDVAASYLIGLGLAAVLAGRATRRRGAVLVAVGVAWVALVIAIGSGKGSSLAGSYAYLAGKPAAVGLGASVGVAWGILQHPLHALDVLRARWDGLVRILAASGTIGICSALGLGMALVVVVPDALNQAPDYMGPAASFQNLAAVVFLVVGGVTVLVWLARRGRWGRWAACGLGILALAQAVTTGATWVPRIPSTFALVGGPAVPALQRAVARTPADAEVVASQGVIGRFGGHRYLYPYLDSFGDGQTVPIHARSVVFVFATGQGIEAATPAQTRAAVAVVRTWLRATPLVSTATVSAFLWHPPAGLGSIHFTR